MMKGLFVLFFIFMINRNIYTAPVPAPANTNIGAQAVVTYTKASGERVLSSSNPVSTKVNEVVAFELTGFSAEIKADSNGNIDIPYRIDNQGNIKDSYIIGFGDPTYFKEGKFIIDENNNGTIDSNETRELEILGPNSYKTPPVDLGGSINFHFVGKLRENIEGANLDLSLKASSTVSNTLMGTTPTKIILQDISEVRIRKSIEYDESKKQLYFTFKFYNGHSDDIKDIELEDIIDKNFIINSYTGYWIPFGTNEKKAVTFFKDGYETEAPEVEVDLLSNFLNFKLKKIPGNTLQTSPGGILYIPFIINPKLPEDTILKNTGLYTYNTGLGRSNKFSTNEITYVIPYMSKLSLIGQTLVEKDPAKKYTFHNIAKNEGNSADLYSVSAVNKINFPEGTLFTFKIKNQDGTLVNMGDNDGDGIIDTGYIEPGQSLDIYLEVEFPGDVHSLDQTYSVNKLLVSKKNPNYRVSVADTLRGELKVDEIGFKKMQSVRGGAYTEGTVDLIEGETILYKFIISKKETAPIPGELTFKDRIPSNTILNKEGGLIEGGKPFFVIKRGETILYGPNEITEKTGVLEQVFTSTILNNWTDKGDVIEIYFNVKVIQ